MLVWHLFDEAPIYLLEQPWRGKISENLVSHTHTPQRLEQHTEPFFLLAVDRVLG